MIGEFDRILESEVFSPWKLSCSDRDNPWEASPSLKKKWRDMQQSSDRLDALAGAFALCRTSKLDKADRMATEDYFNRLVDSCVPFDVLIAALLSGASPPRVFIQSFLACGLSENPQNALYLELLSAFLRHPSMPPSKEQDLLGGDLSSQIKFLANANPSRPDTFALKNRWGDAQSIFTAKDAPQTLPTTEISCLALSLRANWEAGPFRRTLSKLCLEDVFSEEVGKHPVWTKGASPSISHSNPSKHAIAYFENSDSVSRVWRFYNPLLILPWLMDAVERKSEPLLWIGSLICGGVPSKSYFGRGMGAVGRLLTGHPLSIP